MSVALRLLPLAAIAFALCATSAAAEPVASTTHGTLTAADNGTKYGEDRILLTLRGTGYTESDSDYTPLWAGEDATVDHLTFDYDKDTVLVVAGGAVPAEVTTVELRYGKQVLRMPTVPGDGYQGRHTGQVRFYAGEIQITNDEFGDPGGTLFFDAAGTLLAQDDVHFDETNVRLVHRRVAGTRLELGATLTSEDDPLPLDGGHLNKDLCLTAFSGRGDDDTTNGYAACQDEPAGLEPMRLGGLRGCGKVPTTLAGFVPADAREAEVVLGSGRRVRYPTRATPFGRAERVVAAILPRGEAVRSAAALDAAGKVLVRGAVGTPPPDRRCGRDDRQWSWLSDEVDPDVGDPPGTQIAAGSPGAPQLLVRETGELVCVGLDALALDGSDCDDPPLRSRTTGLMVKHYPDGRTAVAVMVAAKVTGMSLVLKEGTRLLLPVTEAAAYTGRLGSVLHFAFTVLAPGQTPLAGDLLDAGGRRIGAAINDDCSCDDEGPLRTVLRGRLGRARYRLTVAGSKGDACFTLATGRKQPTECDDFGGGDADVDGFVSCETRVSAVYGLTPHHVKRIEIELTSHRRVEPAIRSFGRNRFFLALLPRHSAVRAVRFVGLRRGTVKMPLLAPARQCGYTFHGFL